MIYRYRAEILAQMPHAALIPNRRHATEARAVVNESIATAAALRDRIWSGSFRNGVLRQGRGSQEQALLWVF